MNDESAGHKLKSERERESGRESEAPSPPDVYHARIERLQSAADRSRAKREAKRKERAA